jgi:hypothetical protein
MGSWSAIVSVAGEGGASLLDASISETSRTMRYNGHFVEAPSDSSQNERAWPRLPCVPWLYLSFCKK